MKKRQKGGIGIKKLLTLERGKHYVLTYVEPEVPQYSIEHFVRICYEDGIYIHTLPVLNINSVRFETEEKTRKASSNER